MKFSLFVAALLSVTLMSCSTTKPIVNKNPAGKKNEAIQSGEVRRNLVSNDKADTVESYISYMYYKTTALPYQDTANRMIKEFISGAVSYGTGATDQNSDMSEEFINESLDGFVDEYNRQSEFVEGVGVWSTESNIEILEKSEHVEVSMSYWVYAGGAHGNSWSSQELIDVKTGKKLLLTDFISDIDALTKNAEKIFRADQDLSPDANLTDEGFWFPEGRFELNENFTFNGESLDFMYNTYEIAPYVAGPFFISIPMSEVKPFLIRKVK